MSKYDNVDLVEMSDILKALANPHRLQIFMSLACHQVEPADGACNDGQICACVSALGKHLDLAPSTVSHHIKELARAGLIIMTRKGQMVECQANMATVRLLTEYFQSMTKTEDSAPANFC